MVAEYRESSIPTPYPVSGNYYPDRGNYYPVSDKLLVEWTCKVAWDLLCEVSPETLLEAELSIRPTY